MEELVSKAKAAAEACRPYVPSFLRKTAFSQALGTVEKLLAVICEKYPTTFRSRKFTKEDYSEVDWQKYLVPVESHRCAACGAESRDMRCCAGVRTA